MLAAIRSVVGNDPQGFINAQYQTNPKFREFYDSIQGKSPEEAFQQYGYDYRSIMG